MAATVLLGFAEALAAPEVLWSLSRKGFNTIAFARKGRPCPLRHSRLVTVHDVCPPEQNFNDTESDLRSLLERISESEPGPHVLFPLDDVAVRLSSNISLNKGWVLAGPSGERANLALDKWMQVQAAADAGFKVPCTTLASTVQEVLDGCAETSLPLILKAANCVPVAENRVRKCPAWICGSMQEVHKASKEWAEQTPVLVQQFAYGTGEGMFGMAVSNGIRAWSAHRRLRMMNPQGSGSSACVSQAVPDELSCNVSRLLGAVNWRGLFMVELLRDASGQAWFVELNGRPWGSMALSRRQGLEYPAWQVELLLDPDSPAGLSAEYTPGIVCRNVGRELTHLLFVLRGPKSKAQNNWPSFWNSLRNVLHVRRGDTFYNWDSGDARVFFADCVHTLQTNVFKARN